MLTPTLPFLFDHLWKYSIRSQSPSFVALVLSRLLTSQTLSGSKTIVNYKIDVRNQIIDKFQRIVLQQIYLSSNNARVVESNVLASKKISRIFFPVPKNSSLLNKNLHYTEFSCSILVIQFILTLKKNY